MGEFVIEYCGEVISCDEARMRSQKYELEGLQDAYIISLSGAEFIDATKKGSLGRFINHSCDPNCETRKWTVLGEVRVGIFAKQDIKAGTELTYNYNFEWYGGAKVRCRCGAGSCVGFLGAKSRGFQEDTYVWDDNDDRFSVENVPLYDSEDDEPLSNLVKQSEVCGKLKVTGSKSEGSTLRFQSAGEDNADIVEVKNMLEVVSVDIEGNDNRQNIDLHVGMQEERVTSSRLADELIKEELSLTDIVQGKLLKVERNEERSGKKRKQAASSIDVRKRMGTEKLTLSHRKLRLYLNQNPNNVITSHVKAHDICQYLSSKRACEELLAAEEAEAAASMELSRLHEKLRPSMEDLGKDAPDNLPLSTAEEWIALTCKQMMTVFDFNYKAIRSLPCFSSGLLDREPVPN